MVYVIFAVMAGHSPSQSGSISIVSAIGRLTAAQTYCSRGGS
jgi:hypothetical protein